MPAPISSFLSKLDLQSFQKLLELDEAMKEVRGFRHVADFKSILDPASDRTAKRKETLQFLQALSAEQFWEAMALLEFGRGDIEDTEYVSRGSACETISSQDLDYLVGKFGNDYFLKAVKRFGFEIVDALSSE